MFVFRKIWRALFSYYLHLVIRPFALLPTKLCKSFLPLFWKVQLFPNLIKQYGVLFDVGCVYKENIVLKGSNYVAVLSRILFNHY